MDRVLAGDARMSETPETTEPVDVPFIKPVTIEQTGPELRLRVADLEEWLRALPIEYPDEPNRCAEIHLTPQDGLTIVFASSNPWTMTTVHFPVVSWVREPEPDETPEPETVPTPPLATGGTIPAGSGIALSVDTGYILTNHPQTNVNVNAAEIGRRMSDIGRQVQARRELR